MSFSPEWNTAYENGQRRPSRHIRPELYVLIQNFIGGDLTGQRFLELGCGTGNNADCIVSLGGEYFGVDGSESVIREAAAEKYHGSPTFACADFTISQPFGDGFDVVFDRAAVAHNDHESIRRAIALAYDSLKPCGIYIGVDWFSILHSEFKRGAEVDALTRRDYPDGQFLGAGTVHFTHEGELRYLFQRCHPLWIVERVTRYPEVGIFMSQAHQAPWVSAEFLGKQYLSAVFDFVVRKPA